MYKFVDEAYLFGIEIGGKTIQKKELVAHLV